MARNEVLKELMKQQGVGNEQVVKNPNKLRRLLGQLKEQRTGSGDQKDGGRRSDRRTADEE